MFFGNSLRQDAKLIQSGEVADSEKQLNTERVVWTCLENSLDAGAQFPESVLHLGLALHTDPETDRSLWALHSWRYLETTGQIVEPTSVPKYYFGIPASSGEHLWRWTRALAGVETPDIVLPL